MLEKIIFTAVLRDSGKCWSNLDTKSTASEGIPLGKICMPKFAQVKNILI